MIRTIANKSSKVSHPQRLRPHRRQMGAHCFDDEWSSLVAAFSAVIRTTPFTAVMRGPNITDEKSLIINA